MQKRNDDAGAGWAAGMITSVAPSPSAGPEPSTPPESTIWRAVERRRSLQLLQDADDDEVLEQLAGWAADVEELALATREVLSAALDRLAEHAATIRELQRQRDAHGSNRRVAA